MDKSDVLKSVSRFSDLLRTIFNPVMVILYGSYAKGTQTLQSDIDVAVIVDSMEGDFLDQEARLYQLRRTIDDRIEPVLLEMDNDRSGFMQTIISTGEIVYKR